MLSKYLIQHNRIIKLFITFMFVVFLCSCGGGAAFNRTENIQSVWPAISYTTDKHIVIQVVDKRPDVLSKKVNPTYVGMMRGGFGNPFNMNTESGQPLANDIAIAINNGFRNSGIKSDIFNGSSPNSQNKNKYRRLDLTLILFFIWLRSLKHGIRFKIYYRVILIMLTAISSGFINIFPANGSCTCSI